jgi:hypothetical protein
MVKKLAILICAVAVAASAYAQQPKSAATPKPAAKPAEASPAAAPAKPAPAQPINMRIDVTITDQRADAPAIVKTVSLTTSDTFWGRIRTQGEAQLPNGQRVPVVLNVDAKPVLVHDGMARVEMTIEYRPSDVMMGGVAATPGRDPSGVTPNINESLVAILDDGKSMLISQSADPVGDRKVKVEAKMSILK